MILAVWLLSLPFRLLAGLGLRRSVILACLLVLAVTAYGVAEDLGLLDPPAAAKPKPARQAPPSSAAVSPSQPRKSRNAAAIMGRPRVGRRPGSRGGGWPSGPGCRGRGPRPSDPGRPPGRRAGASAQRSDR